MKRRSSLLIAIPAACIAIVLALLAIDKWGWNSDSDKQTKERESEESDSAALWRKLSAKTWDCGGDKSNLWAVKAVLKKGTLSISGSGNMRNFYECRYLVCPKYEEVAATLERQLNGVYTRDVGVDEIAVKIDLGRKRIWRGREMRGCEGWAPWSAGDFTDSITNAVIKNGVTHIGEMAFVGLPELKSVSIPASVSSIGKNAFNTCSSRQVSDCGDYNLESIDVAANNAVYSSVDGVLFNKDKTALILYPRNKQQDAYTIPNSVTAVEERAFIGARLKSVTIPRSVTSIGKDAFAYSDLTSVIVPGSVTKIEESVFRGCVGLAAATIEDGVTSIGPFAFQACTSLTSIKIPRSAASVGGLAFNLCLGLTSVTIENGVDSIGETALDGTFSECARLTSITLPASVTFIGSHTFYECKKLTSVTILNPVPIDITKEPFYGISPNVRLYVPKGSISAYRRAWRNTWNNFESVNEIAEKDADYDKTKTSNGTLNKR